MEKEYEYLRADLSQNNNIMHGLLGVLFAGAGLVSAFVFTTDEPLLFIAVFIMIAPIVTKVSLLFHANVRIATYMILFLEPYLENQKWETRYYESLKNIAKKPVMERIGAVLLMSNATNAMVSVVVYVMFIVKLVHNLTPLNLWLGGVVNTVFLVYILSFFIRDARCLFNRTEYIDDWKRIEHCIEP